MCACACVGAGAATTPAGNVNEKGVYGFVMRIVRTLLNWRFSVPFLVNQTGSMVYNFLLGNADISMASPICNSLTFVFTGITARALGEKQPITWQTVVGTALILAGVATCVASKL
ncbi:hypothetical protein EON67_05865 [archaeon]|nr:MAG: hypothetical protein EON67_05865 [archaeon]